MNKKGFTLVELLATIVIMGIIIAIAVPSYIHITQSTKEKAYESKKEYIEAKAISYASENDLDPATITVADLINAGYIEADSDGKFSNPKGGYLDCYQIVITRNNGEYTAELTSVEAGDCTVTDNNNLNIMAYPYNLANSTLGVKIEADNWTNQDVILYVDLTALSNKNIKSIKWTSGTIDDNKTIDKGYSITTGVSSDSSSYCNEEKVSASVFLNSKYIVEVTLDDGTVKTGSYTVKIDKEKPVVTGNVDNTWTSEDKKVNFTGSDGDGSGIKEFYVTSSSDFPLVTDFDSPIINGIPTNNQAIKVTSESATYSSATYSLDVDTYYAYAIDNAGNISDAFPITVSNIDDKRPGCYKLLPSEWTNKPVTIQYGCTDEGSGCKCSQENGNNNCTSGILSKTFSKELTSDFKWTTYDNLNNKRSCSLKNKDIKIDTTKPTCVYPAKLTTSWVKGTVSISYGCNDAGGSGCASITYNKKTNKCTKTSDNDCISFTNTETFNSYTNKELTWKIEDNVGNQNTCQKTIKIKIDNIKPTVKPKMKTLYLDGSTTYNFIKNVTTTCGPSGCKTVCNPNKSKGKAVKSVTCTAINAVGVSSDPTTFDVKYGYKATETIKKNDSCKVYCHDPYDCYMPADEAWRSGTNCTYTCDYPDNPTPKVNVKSWRLSSDSQWYGAGDGWCQETYGDYTVYSCPDGGTDTLVNGTHFCVY